VTCTARPPVLPSSPAASPPSPPPARAPAPPPPPPLPPGPWAGCPRAAAVAGGRAPWASGNGLGFLGAGCMQACTGAGRLPHRTRGDHASHTRRSRGLAQVSFVSRDLPSYPQKEKSEPRARRGSRLSPGGSRCGMRGIRAGAGEGGSLRLGFLRCHHRGRGTGQAWQVPRPGAAPLVMGPGTASHWPFLITRWCAQATPEQGVVPPLPRALALC
jgi:hypothetical protein